MPGLRAALPAALLLLSSFPPAAAERLPWPQVPGVMHPLNPSHREAVWAAWTALHYINSHEASPSRPLALHKVVKAAAKMIPRRGWKYYVHCTTEGYIHGENAGSCFATVLYLKKSPPVVHGKCVHAQNKKQIQEEDHRFYEYLQHQKKPITANYIPDSHGNIAHDHLQLWGLAIVGSSHIMWKQSTEHTGYLLAQVSSVKQQIRKDNAVAFKFIVLLHEIPTQQLNVCHMYLVWTLGHPIRVKYSCAPDNHGLEDGSGQDSGSAAGTSHETKGNF
uniref:Ovocalyxin-32 n=1 Tax=Gallus gallus TaxID=9031 RepID=C7G541_CHICK|nr:ovocalyxin-32 [Gallus gallus]